MTATGFAYVADVAERGLTARREREQLDAIVLRSRVLFDGRDVTPACTLLGHDLRTPILGAPTAHHGLAHVDGEVTTITGCADAGSLACISTGATRWVDDYGALGRPWWHQLYPMADDGLTRELVARAIDNGASAVVLTADVPLPVERPPLAEGEGQLGLLAGLGLDDAGQNWVTRTTGKALTWDELAWVRELCGGVPLLVKGVLDVEDARRLAAEGVDGIVVSTHGARQLDGAPAPAEVLPAIAEAVDGRCTLLADGSVRTGTDVLKLLVRGASAVMVGRPTVWGLACGGAAGVTRVIEHLTQELRIAMAMTACERITDVGPHLEYRHG